MSKKPIPPYLDDLIKRYIAGESCEFLSFEYGLCRSTINRFLRIRGVHIRNRSEGMYARMALTSAEERQRLSSFAHDAVRGVSVPQEQLLQRAKDREKSLVYVGDGEEKLYSMLEEKGIIGIKQMAVDRYNIDIGASPVAVELLVNAASPLSRKRDSQKIEYLTKHGWSVIYIWIRYVRYLTERHADYVATYIKAISRDPSLIGEYRVIGRDCKLYSSGRFYS